MDVRTLFINLRRELFTVKASKDGSSTSTVHVLGFLVPNAMIIFSSVLRPCCIIDAVDAVWKFTNSGSIVHARSVRSATIIEFSLANSLLDIQTLVCVRREGKAPCKIKSLFPTADWMQSTGFAVALLTIDGKTRGILSAD